MTADPPTYFQVVHLVTLQHSDPKFSLTASRMGGYGTSTPDRSGATHTAPELTNNVTSTPESATSTAIGGGNQISNITPPTGLEDQELLSDIDTDIASAVSFGEFDNNSTCLV